MQPIIHVAEYIVVGDVCAFRGSNHSVHLIGRVLQFAKYYKGKPFCRKSNYARIENGMAVLCTWYDLKKEKSHRYTMTTSSTPECYSVSIYLCTLTKGCFTNDYDSDEIPFNQHIPIITLEEEFTLRHECFVEIERIMVDIKRVDVAPPSPKGQQCKRSKKWITIDKLALSEKERSIIVSGQKRNDVLINAAQKLLKKEFGHLNGLQCPLYQMSRPLTDYKTVIQIINPFAHTNTLMRRHVVTNNWR